MYWLTLFLMFAVMPLTTLGLMKSYGADFMAQYVSESTSECTIAGTGKYPEIIFQETPTSPVNPLAKVVSVDLLKGPGAVDTCQYQVSDGVKKWVWISLRP